jgi:hypothetical protein
MGWTVPRCRRCDVEMVIGHMLDYRPGEIRPPTWQDGEPKLARLFGIEVGTGVVVDPSKQLAVSGYRCPDCGLLELYAR